MKKVLFILVCVMACMTAMSASAQETSKNLSQGQWNHGLAIGAQWIATDLGFAQAEDKVISRTNENYSLEDLKVMYGAKANWVKFHDKLKAHENETGDVNKLIETIAAEYDKGAVIKNGVKRDVEKYVATHTGNEVNTQGDAVIPNAAPEAADAQQITNASDSTATKDEAKEEASSSNDGGHGLLYILSILGLALGAIGSFLAFQTRKESQAIMRDCQDDINNLQKQIDKLKSKGVAVANHEPKNQHKSQNKLDEKDGIAQTAKINFDNKPAQPKQETKKAEPKKEEPKKFEQPKKEEPKPAEPKKEAAKPAPALASHASCLWPSPMRTTTSLALRRNMSQETPSSSSPQ